MPMKADTCKKVNVATRCECKSKPNKNGKTRVQFAPSSHCESNWTPAAKRRRKASNQKNCKWVKNRCKCKGKFANVAKCKNM